MNFRPGAYSADQPLLYSTRTTYSSGMPGMPSLVPLNTAKYSHKRSEFDAFTPRNNLFGNQLTPDCCCRMSSPEAQGGSYAPMTNMGPMMSNQLSPLSGMSNMPNMPGMTDSMSNQMPGMNMNEGMSTVGPSSKDFQFGLSNQTKNQLLNYQQGNPLSFSFQLFNKQTNQPQTQFDIDAEKKVHVFLVSKDQKTYKHVHPIISPDGTLQINSQDPQEGFNTKDLSPGDYYLYAQFKPTGSSDDQVLMEPIHLGSPTVHTPPSHLSPDTNEIKNIDGYTVQMTNPPTTTSGAGAGMSNMQGMNMPTLTITQNEKPVLLKPYLGMASHATLLSQDGTAFEHVHPMLNSNQTLHQNGQTLYQGPIQFHTNISKPGTYTMFSQFLIDDGSAKGKLITVPYTFNVQSSPPTM